MAPVMLVFYGDYDKDNDDKGGDINSDEKGDDINGVAPVILMMTKRQ